MGRGRSGGGHRSFGGGGGRSHGGRSFGGSSRSGRGGSHHSYSRSYHTHYGRSYGGTYVHVGSSRLMTWVVSLAVLFVIAVALVTIVKSGPRPSTVEREKIDPYKAFDTDCYIDEVNWIHNPSKLIRGMETFYKKTGVQPYLLISDNVYGEKYCDDDVIEQRLNEVYDELAEDNEACIVVGFFEWYDSFAYMYYVVGESAQTVMDTEACDILCDYGESLYESDLDDEEYFSEIWSRTASRIMRVTPTVASTIPIIVAAVFAIAILVFVVYFIKMKYKREKEKAEETERILNSPIEKL